MNKDNPILTELNIDIGSMFVYLDSVWVRIDRYVATSPNFGACRFGTVKEFFEENEKDVKIEKLDMKKVRRLIMENLNDTNCTKL